MNLRVQYKRHYKADKATLQFVDAYFYCGDEFLGHLKFTPALWDQVEKQLGYSINFELIEGIIKDV